MKLTEKQRRFADYYIETGNATDSAVRAGYSKKTARVIGQENLLKPAIKAYVDEKMAELADKRIMGAQEALELLTSIARGETKDSVVVSGGWGYKVIEKLPDINQRKDAAKEVLKRFPMHNQNDLKDKLLEEKIRKTKAETSKLENEGNTSDPPTIHIVDRWGNDD